MSLTTGLNIARSALTVTGAQTAIVSRNIASVNDPNYTRRTASVVSLTGGGIGISSITRATDKILFDARLDASSRSLMQDAIAGSLDRLHNTVGDPADDTSISSLVGAFTDALQLYSSNPSDGTAASAAVSRAADLSNALNDASNAVQSIRRDADAGMANSVDRINALLSQIEEVNNVIVGQGASRADLSDYLDQRDALVSELSGEIGIKTKLGSNNDLVIYTDSGVTLFQTRARAVTFQASGGLSAGSSGNAVYVDGVPVTGDAASMALHSGRLAGYAAIRDEYAPRYQTQLDEVARGLIETFAETDQNATPTLPDVPGLFTWDGAPAMPGSGVAAGLAGSIRISASVNPAEGGDPSLLRDGGISDPGNAAYIYNTTGAAGFTGRLQSLITALGTQRSFDASAALGTNATLSDYASASAGWLEEMRSSSSAAADYSTTLLNRATEALSNKTGVNLDEEMTTMLELERSYQASAKLLSTIDQMFDTLLSSVGT
ncbi:flagellar hook-associated protein FlgK [soil metagenome]